MITRRTLLKGAAAVSAAALAVTLWRHPKPVMAEANTGTLHLNARYYYKPDLPHVVTVYSDGNVWYSLTEDHNRAMDLNALLHGVEGQ